LYSLIEAANANDLEPYSYLAAAYILEIADGENPRGLSGIIALAA